MSTESTTYPARTIVGAKAVRATVPHHRRVFSWRNIRGEPRFLIGSAFIGLLIVAALLAPLLNSADPSVSHPVDANQAPSAQHPLGTDDLGRDVLGRTLYGARISLSVGIIAVGIGLGFGVSLGLTAGYRGGWVDMLISRFVDALLAFPALLL